MPRLRLIAILTIAAAGVLVCNPGRALAQTAVQTQPIDPFGQEIALTPKAIVYASGSGSWDEALDALIPAFKTVREYLEKQGIKATGPEMTIYTSTDDHGFNFQAAIPVAEPPKTPPPADIAIGTSPEGKALKFVHRGSFESTVTTYDSISHYLEEKQIEAKELLIEEYTTDLVTSPEAQMVINIFVPLN